MGIKNPIKSVTLDLDPTKNKVIAMALLTFAEALVGGTFIILQGGEFPTPIQIVTILCFALMQLITYFLTFLRTGQIPEE
jgi:heme/copper-type cytochrome/quinol oxidase subunit 4